MKKIKRVLAILLTLAMLLQPVAMALSASDFLDFPFNNWSAEAMNAAVENGLLTGDGNGRIEPDRILRRNELAAIVTRAFGATTTADISHFTDVSPSDWYYDSVSKIIKMGVMNGTSSTTFHPEKSVSREEVFVVLARALCIEGTNAETVKKFSDNGDISDWALISIAGLVENGYINGYPDGTLRPRDAMTRAELAQTFHNLFKKYIDTPGYHNKVVSEGSVIVRVPGVHIENTTINGDLIIADGVGAGDFDLSTVNVKGRIIVRGGEGAVTFKKVTAGGKVVVFDPNGTVNFKNYRTDAPFKNNTIEYTPATYLTVAPIKSGGGGGGGGGYVPEKRYGVFFYSNNTLYEQESVKSGELVTAPAGIPTKPGYAFIYWSEDKNDDGTGTGFDFTTPITKVTKLYAIFGKMSRVEHYNGDALYSVVYCRTGYWTLPPMTNPTKTGATFKWWGETADSLVGFDFHTIIADDVKKLYAVYEYDVTFDGSTYPVAKAIHGHPVANPGDGPAVAGKTFKHWSKTAGGTAYDFTAPVTDSFTLYPVYETNIYDITFNLGGGTTKVLKVAHGGTLVVSEIPVLADTATQNFIGWMSADPALNLTNNAIKYYPFERSIEFYPWFIDKDKRTVSFLNDGVAYGTPQEVVSGNYATKPATDPTKAGATFKHWGVSADSDVAFDFASTPITDNITLYAVYEYDVTFDGSTYPVAKVIHGHPVANPGDGPAVAGKIFTHWSKTAGGTAYDFTALVTESFTLYPVYSTDVVAVTFINDGVTHHTANVAVGATVTAPTAPTKAGATFKHWGVSADSAVAFDFATVITTATTLHAVYEYDVTFDGSTYPVAKVIHGHPVANPGDGPAVAGKIFTHWSKTAGGTAYDFTALVTESFMLYPVYAPENCTVTFYDLSLSDAPLFDVTVDYGATLADDQYPHHASNLGDGVLDYGVEGYKKNASINNVYTGIDFVHKVPMSYWYKAGATDTKWTKFDSTVAITRDTNVYINIKEVSLTVDVPQISSSFSLKLIAPYDEDTRVIDTFKDALFISESTVKTGFNQVENKVKPKLVDKNVIDDSYNIKNVHKYIYFVTVLGKDKVKELIWKMVDNDADHPDPATQAVLHGYVDALIEQISEKKDIEVNNDNLFLFEILHERLGEFTFDTIKTKLPAKLQSVLPLDHVETLYNRVYNHPTYGYLTAIKNAVDTVKADSSAVVYLKPGVTMMINPVSDVFAPALEYILDMKGLSEGKLSAKFPTYYSYYTANPYVPALESYLTVGTLFNGSDAGFVGEFSGYQMKDFDEYYDLIKAVTVLVDDAICYYYNEVPAADRDKVLEIAFTKLLDGMNIFRNIILDYSVNGIPDTLEKFVLSIESDPTLVNYINKFGVDAYLDKISGNSTASGAYDKLADKFGAKAAALISKFVGSKLDRDYDDGERAKALEILNGMFTTDPADDIISVDTICDDYLGGVEEKSITKKGITVAVARYFLTDISEALY